MAYFSRKQNGIERRCKVLADIVSGALLLAFSIAFFGIAGGVFAFIVLEAGLLSVDYVVPSEDDAAGATVR
jgi:hypothetical protein